MADFFSSAGSNAVGTLITEYLVKPVERRIRYMFRFHKIVEDFKEQKKKLTTAQTQLQEEVNESERQNQVIEEYVRDWLMEAKKVLEELPHLEKRIGDDPKCCNCCPNWCWRYQLSKKIDQKKDAIITIVTNASGFNRIGHRADLPGIEFFPSDDPIIASKSSTSAINQIMENLKFDEINMIGVWGKAGVGKTALVKEVGREAKKLQLFDRVVIISNVSQTNSNIENIQDKIADILELNSKKVSKEGKAEELWLRLQCEKKILIILDDIGKRISLNDIGIPIGKNHVGCKIIFTTRKEKICNSMESQVVVSVDVLDEDEAWNLFKMNAKLDHKNASSEITKVAMEIAKECKGLPKAIVIVAKALKGKSVDGWKLAWKKIKSGRLLEIESLQEEDKKVLSSVLSN